MAKFVHLLVWLDITDDLCCSLQVLLDLFMPWSVKVEASLSLKKQKKSFDQLKSALTSPPILAMPMDSGEFILDTDAANETVGALLSQIQEGQERVIAYASRRLDRKEMNYCVTRKELLAVVYFLRYFKQYLLGREFRIRTDHSALTWLKHTPEPIGQQVEIYYPGREVNDKVADNQNATTGVSQLNVASADNEVAQGEVEFSPWSPEGLKMEQ